ncbi:hypothetical protein ACJMK2_040687 [Sinanodonta woodiana]|uniref:Uncharacterized protein n=1 Tax=Sinanodonta woodiana TaxID=1069815 RepID=A0ABD3W2F0_SINWO
MTTFDDSEKVQNERENIHVGVQERGYNSLQQNVSHRDGESDINRLDYKNLRQETEYLVETIQKLNAQRSDIDEQIRQLQEQDAQRRTHSGEQDVNISLAAKVGDQTRNVISGTKAVQEGCDNFESVCREQDDIITRLRKENGKLQSKVRDKDALLRQLIEKSTELKAIRKDRDRLATQKRDLEQKVVILSKELGGNVIQITELRQEKEDLNACLLDVEELKRRLEREQLKSKQLEIHVCALKEEIEKQSLLGRVPVVCCTDSAVQCPDNVVSISSIQPKQRTKS